MYKHTQTGWTTILLLGAGLVFILALPGPAFPLNGLPIVVILLASILLFATLTVSIEGRILHVRFGIGAFRFRIKLDEVSSVETVRNTWYCGYGIHGWFKKGWLLNVSGLDAVELKMKNGMVYRIGTDEPQKLKAAIQANLSTVF